MSLNGISLTIGMRNNLLSLQNTSTSINRTQERLSSGKKVNSALDNPTNYFAAQSHLQRGEDLAARKDGMSEAIQMIKTADAGIKAITSLLESAKGVALAALATTSSTDRTTYATTFDTLLTQISDLASDSGYRGTNLLTSGTQTIEFSQTTGTSTLAVSGFDATSSGLGLSKTTEATTSTTTTNNNPAPDATENVTAYLATWGSIAAPSGPFTPFSFTPDLFNTIYNDRTSYRLVDTTTGGYGRLTGNYGFDANPDPDLYAFQIVVTSGTMTGGDNFVFERYDGGVNQTTGLPNPVSTTTTTPGGSTWETTGGIQSSAAQLENATTTLRTQSAKLSSNMSVVTTRQDFTSSMINTLKTGADGLTLADMNEEGANMLMLQTQQNLGITSLSMASQSAQSVMRLF